MILWWQGHLRIGSSSDFQNSTLLVFFPPGCSLRGNIEESQVFNFLLPKLSTMVWLCQWDNIVWPRGVSTTSPSFHSVVSTLPSLGFTPWSQWFHWVRLRSINNKLMNMSVNSLLLSEIFHDVGWRGMKHVALNDRKYCLWPTAYCDEEEPASVGVSPVKYLDREHICGGREMKRYIPWIYQQSMHSALFSQPVGLIPSIFYTLQNFRGYVNFLLKIRKVSLALQGG
jgi:hypothetical protein